MRMQCEVRLRVTTKEPGEDHAEVAIKVRTRGAEAKTMVGLARFIADRLVDYIDTCNFRVAGPKFVESPPRPDVEPYVETTRLDVDPDITIGGTAIGGD